MSIPGNYFFIVKSVISSYNHEYFKYCMDMKLKFTNLGSTSNKFKFRLKLEFFNNIHILVYNIIL